MSGVKFPIRANTANLGAQAHELPVLKARLKKLKNDRVKCMNCNFKKALAQIQGALSRRSLPSGTGSAIAGYLAALEKGIIPEGIEQNLKALQPHARFCGLRFSCL
ncbi:MAG: hypothetical protein HC848_08215 [Limnobacter sp.]|nr:hypothetical protein [Limnobacter sp.]